MKRFWRRPSQRGFTLVELLIVLVLLSLVMLGMASAMRTAAQTEERVDARLQRVDDLRIANGFLRSVMGRVSGQRRGGVLEVGSSPYFFLGGPAQMQWVGVMPARYGAGGRHHFRLSVTDQNALVLQYQPWDASTQLPDLSGAPSVTLLTDVTGIALQYEDAAEEVPVWMPQWPPQAGAQPGNPGAVPLAGNQSERLPERVMISIQTLAGPLPEFAIPLRVTPASDPRSRGPVFGGDV